MNAVKVDREFLQHAPRRECGGRFCFESGPATHARIEIDEKRITRLIGFCEDCDRYVCGTCAICSEGSRANGAVFVYCCCYCGEPLGNSPERLLVDRHEDEADLNEPVFGNKALAGEMAMALWRQMLANGIVTTVNLARAQSAYENKNFDEAIRTLDDEGRTCRDLGFDAGRLQCQLFQCLIAYTQKRYAEAAERSEQASGLARQLEAGRTLALALQISYRSRRDAYENVDERLRALREIEAAASGVDDAIHSWSQTERIREFLNHPRLADTLSVMLESDEGVQELVEVVRQISASCGGAQDGSGGRKRLKLVTYDEVAIRRRPDSHHAWGCPNGCEIAKGSSVAHTPSQLDVERYRCPKCKETLVGLDRYNVIYGGTEGRFEPAMLEFDAYGPKARGGVATANFALCLLDRQATDRAAPIVELSVRQLEERLSPSPGALASVLSALGLALQERYDFDGALMLFERAVALAAPETGGDAQSAATYLNNLGSALTCLGRFGDAELHLNRAVELAPSFPNPLFWLGTLHFHRAAATDREREIEIWKEFLKYEGIDPRRKYQAEVRLAVLEGSEHPPDPDESSPVSNDFLTQLKNFAALLQQSRENPDQRQ